MHNVNGAMIEKARYKWRPRRRKELLLDADTPCFTLYMDPKLVNVGGQ